MLGREHVLGHPALTDSSTGLANRLHFEVVYSYLFAGADRGVPLTLMVISVPEPEDHGLRMVGRRIHETTRASDLVAYLEHGRFAVLLLGSNLSGGRVAADRVEAALQGVPAGKVSIGLASYRPEMKEATELLAAADEALRSAEAAGGGVEMS